MKTYHMLRLALPLAIAALTGSCATTPANLKSKESLALSADFKVITPRKPDQQALLASLPRDQITRITYGGKTYYVLPDRAHNQAYIGGPKQYQTYLQLSHAKQQGQQYVQAEEIRSQQETTSMNWGSWGGWGGWSNNDTPHGYSGGAAAEHRAAYGLY